MKRTLIPVVAVILVLSISTLISFGPNIQPVKAQQQASGSFSDDFSSDSGGWKYLGSAYRDQTNHYIVLTTSANNEAGVAFFKSPIQGPFTANFRYKAGGGGYQGDGFTMFFYKQPYSTVDADSNGGNLGFNSQSISAGYGIEFDGWQNIPWDFQKIVGSQPNPSGDPSADHIALIQDYIGNHLAYTNDSRVADNNWQSVSVDVQASSVTVSIDQAVVLHWSGTLNRTYSCFGFSGGTGEVGTNWHIIDDVSIISENLQTPSLITSCLSQGSQSSFNVYKINGNLTFNGAAISAIPIWLSYSVTSGESWQDLALTNTDSDGSYSALWMPTVTGSYQLKAVYKGDKNYLGTSNIINFAIQPGAEQSVFSVTSNSTLTALFFDSVNQELSFNVTGEYGTRGYVDICIPKSMLNNTSGLKVYMDGKQIDDTVQTQSDNWLLYFSYHHSSHAVTISLGSSAEVNGVNFGNIENYIFLAIIAIMATIIVVLIVAFKSGKKKSFPLKK